MKSGLGNLAACTLDQLAATMRNRLCRIQHRPDTVTGLLGQTGLTLQPAQSLATDLNLSNSVSVSPRDSALTH